MRHARIKAEGEGCYHIVSRIVDRNFRLDDSEKEIFRGLMRRVEAFCGVHVLTYAILSNHFHILLEVPVQGEIDEPEFIRRVSALYGKTYTSNMLRQWDEWRKHGMGYLVENQKNTFKLRMEDVSAFVKTLKQRYSMSYNGRHQRKGTLWEDRFKSVLVENAEHAKATVAAYIDLNPVRAKLVTDPKDYRWSGYGEATGGGGLARKGLIAIHISRGLEQPGDWKHVSMRYRVLLYAKGGEHHAAYSHSITTLRIEQNTVTHGNMFPISRLFQAARDVYSDQPLPSKTSSSSSFTVTTPAIILWVCNKLRAYRVQVNVGRNGCFCVFSVLD
jgi:REP element-mobilizing transposase RayT